MNWTGFAVGVDKSAGGTREGQRRLPSVAHRDGVAIVERTRDETLLWPEPLLQFNPAIGIQHDQVLFADRDHHHLRCTAKRFARDERRSRIGRVATRLIQGEVLPRNMAQDFFSRSRHFGDHVPGRVELAWAIDRGVDLDRGAFELMVHPVGAWLETAIGFDRRGEHFVLAPPRSIAALGDLLAAEADRSQTECSQFLQQFLRWISVVKLQMNGGGKGHTLPRFEPHQFISISGTVFSTLDRWVTRLEPDRTNGQAREDPNAKPIYRNVFSRASGDAFVCVSKCGLRLLPRDFWETSHPHSGAVDGYLILEEEMWNPEEDYDLLPAAWMRETGNGLAPKAKYAPYMPIEIHFDEFGNCADSAAQKCFGWFVRTPLLFDPSCPIF